MSMSDRVKNFLLTGSPKSPAISPAISPRDLRGLEPGVYGGYGEARLGVSQPNLAGGSYYVQLNTAGTSLPRALRDIQNWKRRLGEKQSDQEGSPLSLWEQDDKLWDVVNGVRMHETSARLIVDHTARERAVGRLKKAFGHEPVGDPVSQLHDHSGES
jgi:hypothetical protein